MLVIATVYGPLVITLDKLILHYLLTWVELKTVFKDVHCKTLYITMSNGMKCQTPHQSLSLALPSTVKVTESLIHSADGLWVKAQSQHIS